MDIPEETTPAEPTGKSGKQVASFLLNVTIRQAGDEEVPNTTNDSVERVVKTAIEGMLPGSSASVSATRTDR